MCGIFIYLARKGKTPDLEKLLAIARQQRHRGPDYEGWYVQPKVVQVHHRLAIIDPAGGKQPLIGTHGALAVNGEIYNHSHLKANVEPFCDYKHYRTGSDCEVILPACEGSLDKLPYALRALEGMFAFCYWDEKREQAIVACDPIGIIPLYYGLDDDSGDIYVASEMKAIPASAKVNVVPPGCFAVLKDGNVDLTRMWYPYKWEKIPKKWSDPESLFEMLESQVVSHLQSDVPWGLLLSGGLDSSIIAGLACRHAARRVESDDMGKAWWSRFHTFSCGLKGSPDLAAARLVATALKTVHHEKIFTVEEAIAALPKVIRHIETYDTTTIRASTPMVLLAELVHSIGIKMVLSGEGADEIFGGYLYFAKAPDAEKFRRETVEKVKGLHRFDCLRANKSMMAYAVETRVPFLSTPFVEYAMTLDPKLKMCGEGKIEKHILRETFADIGLPEEVVWRQKEQFSDGVGYNWIDGVKKHAAVLYPNFDPEEAKEEYHINPPRTAEELLYRRIFDSEFPGKSRAKTVPWGASIACSTERAIAWDESFANRADPSGRAVGHHEHAVPEK